MIHEAVLKEEVVRFLSPKPNENFIDCTAGEGGHSLEILKRSGPEGKVIAIDWDEQQVRNCSLNTKDFTGRIFCKNANYADMASLTAAAGIHEVHGILMDLGMSSWQLESGRGFSFLKDESLDMRYSPSIEVNAADIVNRYPERDLEAILRDFGEERFSKSIAKAIVKKRESSQITTTTQLADAISKGMPTRYLHGRIHFATRSFQALRIAVNNELGNLKKALEESINILIPGGRLVVISFHSLEDRIVKNFLREHKDILNVLTKKPLTALAEEIKNNPRARSAKLRAAAKKTNNP